MSDPILPSLITLVALVTPAIVFIFVMKQRTAASYLHSVVMGGICFSIGILVSAASITWAGVQSQNLISLLILIGSGSAALTRLLWIKHQD